MLDLGLQMSPIVFLGVGCIAACIYVLYKYRRPRPSTDFRDWQTGNSDLFGRPDEPLLANFREDVYDDNFP